MTGLRPTPRDVKDRRFAIHRLFGATTVFQLEYDADAGLTLPDQNRDGRPTGCTGYTVTDIATDCDGIVFAPDYNFMKTLELMDVPPTTEGADLRKAFTVPCTFGLLPLTLEPPQLRKGDQAKAADQANWPLDRDADALKNQKIAYLPVQVGRGLDWFDAIRSAMIVGKSEHRTIGLGTPWYASFGGVGDDGILPEPAGSFSWHAYKVTGWVVREGETYLRLKPWQGKYFGDHGYVYMSRATVNKLMSTWGSYAAALQDIPTNTVEELRNRRLTLTEAILSLMIALQNTIIKLKYGLA